MRKNSKIIGKPFYLKYKYAAFNGIMPFAVKSVLDFTRQDKAWFIHYSQPLLTLAVIMEGSMLYEWEKQQMILTPGMAFITVPGSAIAFGNTDGLPYRKIFVPFSGRLMNAISSANFSGSRAFYLSAPDDIIQRIDEIYQALGYASSGNADPKEMTALEYTISERSWALLLRITGDYRAAITKYPPALTAALEFISSNFTLDISISYISDYARVSLTTLRRLFAEHLQTSPLKKLTATRLAHARLLLEQGGISIKEIAIRSGFSSELQFYRSYHATYNEPPSAFKK